MKERGEIVKFRHSGVIDMEVGKIVDRSNFINFGQNPLRYYLKMLFKLKPSRPRIHHPTLIFRLSPVQTTYLRSRPDAFSFIAEFGGLLEFLLVVFSMLTYNLGKLKI